MFEFLKKKKNKEPFGLVTPYEYNPKKNTFEIYFDKEILPCKLKENLNMICIADTHGELLKEENKQKLDKMLNDGCDIIICLGDIRKDELRIICELNKKRFPIIAVKGNHDDMNQFDEFEDITDVNNNIFEINNIKIIGMHGSIKYKGYEYPSYTQEESLELAKTMPNANILITHAHLWEEEDKNKSEYDCHIGLAGATKYFYDNQCFLNIHGHDHKYSNDDTKTLINNGKSMGVYRIERIII